MATFLRIFSGWLFYILGISFFVAYMLMVNEIAVPWPKFWLSVADIPLIVSSMLYGGTSLYVSVKKPDGPSPIIATIITVVLAAVFLFLVCMNFYEYFIPA